MASSLLTLKAWIDRGPLFDHQSKPEGLEHPGEAIQSTGRLPRLDLVDRPRTHSRGQGKFVLPQAQSFA